jgi:hypothetical protein
MLTAIKKGFQRRAYEALRSKVDATRERYFTPLSKARNVILLYKVEDENMLPEFYTFIERLKAKGISVDAIMVGKPKDLQSAYPKIANFFRVSYHDIKWNGAPKNEEIIRLLQKNHDYFIDLSRLESQLCTYLATASLAKFKIGSINIEGTPFDFTIDVDKDTDLSFFQEQMFSYLQKIG